MAKVTVVSRVSTNKNSAPKPTQACRLLRQDGRRRGRHIAVSTYNNKRLCFDSASSAFRSSPTSGLPRADNKERKKERKNKNFIFPVLTVCPAA